LTFLDTSAIYALADRKDPQHQAAKEKLHGLLQVRETLLTHNYVLVESAALIQSRLGLDAAGKFMDSARAFEIDWVDKRLHNEAARRLKASRKRRVSFVDLVSFMVMRSHGVQVAFAFDRHFEEEGFRICEV
jgi:predicted nucleic acid-binding protein